MIGFFAWHKENVIRANKETLFFDWEPEVKTQLKSCFDLSYELWELLTNRWNRHFILMKKLMRCWLLVLKTFKLAISMCAWRMSRHIWWWAASVSCIFPIYMTMAQSDSIISSLWTFNSPMSQLSHIWARHHAKTSGTWSKIPAKVSDCSKPQSNVSWIIAAHRQVHSGIARISSGLEIPPVVGPMCLRCSARIWERFDLRGVKDD